MKLAPVIIISLLLFAKSLTSTNLTTQYSDDDNDNDDDLLLATSEIIFKGFASAVTINFILALSDETKVQHNRLIDNLIASCCCAASASATRFKPKRQRQLTSVFVEDVNFITQRQKLYNVILIDTINSFHQLEARMSERSSNFVIDGYYLMIFVVERSIGELSEVTKRLWSRHSIYNVLIMLPAARRRSLKDTLRASSSSSTDEETRLSLITFKPFASPSKCDDSTPVTVNVFTSRGRFTTDQFFTGKLNDLSKCPIRVVSFNCPPMMMISYNKEGRVSLAGVDGRMLNTLSEVLKFSVDFIHMHDDIG